MERQKPESLVFRFSDPQQQRIYEELKEIVGPGPAAFFRDTCWLTANPEIFETTTLLVAHLLREMESAIRAVFKPVAEGALPGTNGSKSQKEEIKSILAALNIEEGAPEAKAWFKLADRLHSLAHRQGLDAPRSINDIENLWDRTQKLLVILVGALRKNFLAWIQELDKLLEKTQPTKKDLNRLTQKIPNNRVTRQYFFDRLENPEWLEPLAAKNFFRNPPQSERTEEAGTIRFPPWPEGQYLTRMVRRRPECVEKIIHDMDDTDNAAVLSYLVDALLAMPPSVSAKLVEKVRRWAASPYPLYPLLPERPGQLISHLAEGGKTEEAMAIARVLLEPRARINAWHYDHILKQNYPVLVQEAGLPALKLLCDLLEQSIHSSDYSYIQRPAVEDHPQNRNRTIQDALVSAIRDAAEIVVRSSEKAVLEEIVGALERRHGKIFRRISMHIIRVFPNQAKALAAARLTDRALFEDLDLRHEYILLLRDHFPHLTLEDRTKILGWIEDGPEVERWKQWREGETGQQPSEEGATRYRESWQRDRLAWIGLDNLPEEWKEKYQTLCERYGEPDHPAFPAYREGIWEGPTSPKTIDELKAMSVMEIVAFLRTWKPLGNRSRKPSPEGLGRVLSSVVAEDPWRFSTEVPVFQGLDPTYVRAVLSGFRDTLRKDRSFDWEPVLDLCDWVLSQSLEIQGRQVRDRDADPDWGWTRKAIADLLFLGFEMRQGSIPINLRKRVWTILKPLTDAPDPTPEQEQRYGGSNMDPANTTRGEAMHAVICYALWVRRHQEKEPKSEEWLQKGFETMPEVREVLEAHLDPVREPSLAIRAVYGQWFPDLALLDPDWARTHAAKIFLQDQEREAFFGAAWNTYIAFHWPYDNALKILRPFYQLAVDRIGSQRDDTRGIAIPNEKLVEHLMVFYWRGELSLDDPLLALFWETAPDAVKAHAQVFIGRNFEQTEGDIPPETMDRLKRLWEQRFDVAKKSPRPSDFEKEVAAFGWWFASGKFDAEWAIGRLVEVLEIVGKLEADYKVAEKLAEIVETYPLEAVHCLKAIVEGDREGCDIYSEYARKILSVALQDVTAKQKAVELIQYLGSRGCLEFRNFLNN